MKIKFVLVFLVFFAAYLIKLAVSLSVPQDALSMSQMFLKYGLDDDRLDSIKFVKYHPKYLEVIFNGTKVNLKSTSEMNSFRNNIITTSFKSAIGPNGPLYWEYPLSDEKVFTECATETENDYYVTYYSNGYDFQSLVIFDKKDMRTFVDPWSWNNTDATIGVWHEPFSSIVENVTTGELSYVRQVTAVDKDGNEFYLSPDGIIWGHVIVKQIEGGLMVDLTMTEK